MSAVELQWRDIIDNTQSAMMHSTTQMHAMNAFSVICVWWLIASTSVYMLCFSVSLLLY